MTDEMNDRKLLILGTEDKLRALESLELLAACTPAERRELAESAHVVSFDDGDLILREGEEGLGFYLVLSGVAAIRRAGEEINRIQHGGWFGEVALIEGIPRTADVVAAGPTVCLGLLRTDFKRLLARAPRVGLTIIEEEGRRLFGDQLLQSPGSGSPETASEKTSDEGAPPE
jgi:cAMP-dependent protein kinase regulator